MQLVGRELNSYSGKFFGSVSVVLLFPIKVGKGLAHISGGKSLVCGPQ